MVYYANELYHFGIKGQHWGERNYQNEDGSYTAQGQAENNGHGRYSNASNIVNKKDYKTLQKFSKKDSNYAKGIIGSPYFKVGVALAATGLAAYGLYKLNQNNEILPNISPNLEDAKIVRDYEPFEFEADHIEEYRDEFNARKDAFMSLDQIPKSDINYYDEIFNSGPNGISALDDLLSGNNKGVFKKYSNFGLAGMKVEGYFQTLGTRTQNCMLCTTSLVMRMKGYATQAGESPHGWWPSQVSDWFKGAETKSFKGKESAELLETLRSQGNGHYGNIMVQWNNGSGGHSIFYAIINNNPVFVDGQMEKIYKPAELLSKIKIDQTSFADLTNCEPTKKVLKCIDSTIISHSL